MQVQLGKCQRCGQKEVLQGGVRLTEADGADAVVTLTLRERNSSLIAKVCENCAIRMEGLGWKRSS